MLLFSQRRVHRPLFQAAQYEFEDVVAAVDDVEVLSPPSVEPPVLGAQGRRVANAVRARLGAARQSPPWTVPQTGRAEVRTRHDLFFAVFHHAWHASYLQRLQGWKESSSRSACLVVELWPPGVAGSSDYLRALTDFDVVYVFNPLVAPLLADLGVQDVRFLPMAVDAMRFSPWPRPSARSIDVVSYGRRSPHLHQALVPLVERGELHYVYDTVLGGTLSDPREHRVLLADLLKRTQFTLAHDVNDSPERWQHTGGNPGISTRYFEGAAAGAVLLGSTPDSPEFRACFDYPDAVVPVPYDCSGIADVLADLRRQPERLARIRADGVRTSLRRHDWVHRWERVLGDLGLPASPAMRGRQERLDELASVVGHGSDAPQRA